MTGRGPSLLLGSVLLLDIACSGETKEPGQLMVSIQSDMAIPKDVDKVGIRVTSLGRPLHEDEYEVGDEPEEILVPATLNVVEGEDPGRPVTITVWARQSGTLRTLREIVTTVPEARVASLRMPIQWLCSGFAEEGDDCDEGQYCVRTTCGDGQTCVAGRCQTSEVDSAELPDFEETDVFGGAEEPGADGACFDTVPCFSGGSAAVVDPQDCTFAKPEGGDGINVALVLPPGGAGICGPEACLIPLDAESESGWRSSGDRIQVPASVCDKIVAQEIAGVAVTTACATKTESIPTCGPWSSVTSQPGGFEDPPPADVTFPEPCKNAEDGTPCGDSADSDCDGADTCQGGVCVDNVKAEGEPCGDTNETSCSLADTCDGAGTCLPNDSADGTACDDCAAGEGNCSTCAQGKCQSECTAGSVPPPAVEVTAPDGSTTYLVDATEVTNAQYCEFLASEYPTHGATGAPAECTWNDSYLPSGNWPATGLEDHPVVFVDWCDAHAYCEWLGKRLCGQIGGGPNDFLEYANPALSEWQNACSAGGTNTYSFGTVYDGVACNGQDYGAGTTVPVGSLATCEGGYPGLFDLSGNVFEWVNACDATAGVGDSCRVRGGSYLNPGVNLACGNGSQGARDNKTATVGFRCCE